MNLTRETESYNSRRRGKPWIAKITLDGNQLKFNFGSWCGDDGDEGILILNNVEVGEFFARGQKDFRQPKNSAPHYYELNADGRGIAVTKPDIYKKLAGIEATPSPVSQNKEAL